MLLLLMMMMMMMMMPVDDAVNTLCRSGELRGADGAVWDGTTQVPWCVWYSTPTVRHYRHIRLQRLRPASPNGY